MTVNTDVIDIDENWQNLTDGNKHLAIMIRHPSKMRLILNNDLAAPKPESPKAWAISSGTDGFSGFRLSMTFDNLEAGDNIWVRNEDGNDQIVVVRGQVEIRGR